MNQRRIRTEEQTLLPAVYRTPLPGATAKVPSQRLIYVVTATTVSPAHAHASRRRLTAITFAHVTDVTPLICTATSAARPYETHTHMRRRGVARVCIFSPFPFSIG
ncbi:hypothetical protein TRVL_10224 [Trypanosoma vivax]|nr:hypothetical protein TRVL_10224 [Trypanosoma vivax]